MKNLLIFRHTPIDVDIKMYEYFASNLWKGNVYVYSETSFKDCRTLCGFHEKSNNIKTVITDKEGYIFDNSFFIKHKNDFFLFYGIPFANRFKDFLIQYNIKYGIIAERNWSFYENFGLINIIKRNIFQTQYFKNYDILKNLSCFLAMGRVGVDCYRRYYHVDKMKLFSFMYCDGNDYLDFTPHIDGSPLKFVYVGRLDYKFKGVDIMLNAFQNIKNNCTLDIIGDYGDDKVSILNRVSNMPNVRCLGLCKNDELCTLLNRYDIILVPSKLDGWNLHCNLSINAGIGIITTDQAVSHELIENCRNGVIIKSGDAKILYDTITKLVNDPSVVNEWKKNTRRFSKMISYKAVAEYFFRILDYSTDMTNYNERPTPPWIIS